MNKGIFFKLLIFIFGTVNAKTQPLKQSPLGHRAPETGERGLRVALGATPEPGGQTASVHVKPGVDVCDWNVSPLSLCLSPVCTRAACGNGEKVHTAGHSARSLCRTGTAGPNPGQAQEPAGPRAQGRRCPDAGERPAAGPASPALFLGMAEGRAVSPARAPQHPLSRGQANLSPVVWPASEVI